MRPSPAQAKDFEGKIRPSTFVLSIMRSDGILPSSCIHKVDPNAVPAYQLSSRKYNRLQSGINDPFVKQRLITHIHFLECEIQAFRQHIQALVQSDSQLQYNYQLILSIPGIAHKTAPILLAEIGDIQRFQSAKALASYAGLTPVHYQSGSSVQRRSRLSKHGNSHLRTALYMPAMGAPRWNPRCAALKKRLLEKHKTGKSIIAANMHLLLRIVYGVLKHQTPYDPQYLQKQAFVA